MNNNASLLCTRNLGKINFLIVATVLAMAIAPVAKAGGNSVMIGAEKIAIPSVSGFYNYTDDPRGQSLAAALIESNTQILSYQAGPRFNDWSVASTRYLIVKVPKALISQSMSIAEFRTLTEQFRDSAKKLETQKQLGDLATKQAAERREQLKNGVPGHAIDNAKFYAPVLVGIDRDDNKAFSYTSRIPMSLSVDGKSGALTTVMCSSAILVKGKFVIAQLFGPDVESVRSACNMFVADFTAQNK